MKELFGRAIELDSAQREAFLSEVCANDAVLRAELESLLASYDVQTGVLDRPIADAAYQRGRRIGPYQVVDRIGAGGMGAVYLAMRADGSFDKKVAIKVIQSLTGSREILDRFHYERRILATLDHPNIARLLDGGTTEDGVPYLVMDYVDGLRIDEYCAAHDLAPKERIGLFCQVCAAVQYVHQHLVVHRDLKPSNILVTADGVPKLLDFGIAKLLKPDSFRDLTQGEFRPMTPGYASPEQIRGEAVTTASDIYSLGVILYELLAGQGPYRLKGDSWQEQALAACEQEPAPPSRSVPPADKLHRQIRGDLDNIVLKALRKEPQQRYVSAEQLADDLRRHIGGLPIYARPQTWSYRAWKFARRNRAGVAAALLVAVSLAGAALISIRQAQIARRERANAQQQFNDVRKLTTSFLFEFHNAIRDLKGSTPARKLLVQRALEYLSRLHSQAHGDRGLERELAEAYLKVGDVQGDPYEANLGDPKGAMASYSQALGISQTLAAADKNDSLARRYLARSYKSLGELLPVLGRPTEGAADLRKASETLESLHASDPENADLSADLATVYQVSGDLAGHPGIQNLNDKQAARASYRRALGIYTELLAQDPRSKRAQYGLALIRMRIADLAMAPGKQGLTEYTTALETLQALSASDPTNAEALRLLVQGYRKVGGAREDMGDWQGALADYRKAQAINETLVSNDPDNVQGAMSLAITLRYTGDLLAKLGEPAAAMTNYQRILALLQDLSAKEPDNVLVARRRAEMLTVTAELEARGGKAEAARTTTVEALALTRELAGRADATADDLYAYALTFLNCKPEDLREPATALAYARRSARRSDERDSDIMDLLAQAYAENQDWDDAVKAEEKAISDIPPGSGGQSEQRRRLAGRLAQFKARRDRR